MNKHEPINQFRWDISKQKSGQPKLPLRLAGYISGILLIVGVMALGLYLAQVWKGGLPFIGGGQDNEAKATGSWQRPVVSDAGLVDRVGIRIVQIAMTGDGGLIDLRFQVIDPDKALALHDQDNPPAIIDAASGVVADQLLMGHAHTASFNAGQTYYYIFENPGNLVQRGSTVSLLLGDAELDNVSVR